MVEIKNDLINSVNVGNLIADEINVGAHLTSVQSKYCGIASTIFDDHGPKASTGMAALNSVIVPPNKYETGNAFQMIKSKSARKNLGIIGHFHFVNRFSDSVKNCWVFEKSPRDDDIPADKIGEFLPKCDVVVITGQTIINNTLAEILSYSQKAFKIMLGPSVPLSPVLFDHGVDVLAGVKILKSDLVNRFIRQGANFRQLQGVELVMMGKNKI
ncbi:MAG: DUF364 domain-containing protein [Calditrichaceae bacterium]